MRGVNPADVLASILDSGARSRRPAPAEPSTRDADPPRMVARRGRGRPVRRRRGCSASCSSRCSRSPTRCCSLGGVRLGAGPDTPRSCARRDAEGAAAGRRQGRVDLVVDRDRAAARRSRSPTRSTAAAARRGSCSRRSHAGEEARAAYRFPTDRRGRFEIGPLRATLTDPFGLVAASRARARDRAGDRLPARPRHRAAARDRRPRPRPRPPRGAVARRVERRLP